MAMDFHHCWYKTVVFLFLALWTTLSCGTTPYSTIHPTPSSGYSGYMLSYSSRHSQPYMSGSYSGHHPSGYSQPYMSDSYSGHHPSGYSQPHMSGSYSGQHPSGYSQPYISGSYSGHHPSGYSQPYMSGSYSGHRPSGYSQPYMSGSYSGHHPSGYSQPYMSGSYSGHRPSGYSQPYMSGSYSGHHPSGYSQPYMSGSYSGHHPSGYSQPYMSGSYSGHHPSGYSQPYMSGSYSGHHLSGYSQPYMSGSYSGQHHSGYSQPYMSGSYSGHHHSGYSQPYISGSYSGHHHSGYSQPYMSGSYSGHHPSGYSQPYMSGSYSGHHPSGYSQQYMSGSYSGHHPSGYSQQYMSGSYSGHHPSGYSQPYMSGSYSGHHPSRYSQPYMSGSYSAHHPSGYSQPYMTVSYSDSSLYVSATSEYSRSTTASVITTTAIPRDTFTYVCPGECFCKTSCMALDVYGDLIPTFSGAITYTAAFTEFKQMTAFQIDIQISTCEGFLSFFGVYNSLTANDKVNMASFINDPTTVTADTMTRFPKAMFALLKFEVKSRLNETMSDQQKMVICNNWKSVNCLAKSAIMEVLKCGPILASGGESLTTTEKKKLFNIDLFASMSLDDWGLVLQYAPELLNKTHLEAIPVTVLVENMGVLTPIVTTLKTSVIKAIMEVLKVWMIAEGTVATEVRTQWIDLAKACGASEVIMEVLGLSASLSVIDMSQMSREDARKFLEENEDGIDMASLTKDEIVSMIAALDQSDILLLNDAALVQAAAEIFSQNIGRAQMRKIVEAIKKKLPSFFDTTTFDDAKLEIVGPVMGYLSDSEIAQIPDSVLQSGINNGYVASSGKSSRKSAKKMMELFKQNSASPNGAFTTAEIETIGVGVLLSSVDVTTIANIPGGSFDQTLVTQISSTIAEVELSAASAGKLLEKMIEGVGVQEILAKPNLAGKVSTSLIRDGISSMADVTGENAKFDITVTVKQARFLMEYMESQSVPITLERVGNIIAYACAFTEDQINNFVKDDFYLDILYTLVGSPCTSAERIDFLQGLIKDYTSFDSMTAAALTEQTTSATLESIPPNILVRYTRTELLKYGSDLCWKIVDLLSHVDIYVVSRAQIQEAYQYSISCLGKSTGTLTADDLVSLGTMICGLSSLDYDRLSFQALEDFIKQLQRDCPLTYDERVALTSKYVAAKGLTNGTGIRSSDISRLATLFPLLPSSVLSAISDEVLLAEAGTLLDELKEQEKFEESRKQSGLSSDISDGDRTAFESAKRLLYETIATALQSSANTAARRRKRSTASLTCSDLQTLQKSGLSALSTTQLTSLADEDFVDCVEILGAVIDFSEEQETSLLNVAMRTTVWGEPSTWSTDNVYNAGVICQAMSETQITSLTFNLDAVSRLGEFDGWTSVKKKAVFDRWLNQLKGGDSSSITVSELRSLGHITCGAETSHISVIPHTVYKDAADSVGELTSCNDTQLTAFATLAKAAYGRNVTSWLSSVISNIGVIIGGLSADDVVLLSATQIDAIDPNHIPYFPPDIFAGFTVEQFFTFSSAQSSKTTTEQRQALSAAQLAALQLDFSSDDAPRTAASSNFVVVLLPLVLMFLQLT